MGLSRSYFSSNKQQNYKKNNQNPFLKPNNNLQQQQNNNNNNNQQEQQQNNNNNNQQQQQNNNNNQFFNQQNENEQYFGFITHLNLPSYINITYRYENNFICFTSKKKLFKYQCIFQNNEVFIYIQISQQFISNNFLNFWKKIEQIIENNELNLSNNIIKTFGINNLNFININNSYSLIFLLTTVYTYLNNKSILSIDLSFNENIKILENFPLKLFFPSLKIIYLNQEIKNYLIKNLQKENIQIIKNKYNTIENNEYLKWKKENYSIIQQTSPYDELNLINDNSFISIIINDEDFITNSFINNLLNISKFNIEESIKFYSPTANLSIFIEKSNYLFEIYNILEIYLILLII